MKKLLLFFMILILSVQPAAALEEWFVDEASDMLPADPADQVQFLMDKMTAEEKIGQLLMVSPEDLTKEKHTTRINDINCIADFPVGGMILYGQNIVSEEQLHALVDDLLTCTGEAGLYAPFIAVDEEGGQVIRVANKLGITAAPSAEEIGKRGDPSAAYEAGQLTGTYLRTFGINMDLAPVADVLIAAAPEIEERSYGSDPELVGKMAIDMANGLKDSGLIPCFKHFPGHGTITRNTHNVSTGHSRTLSQMQQAELIPFRMAVDNGADMIMISHLTARSLDAKRPASLSPVIIQQLLREEMGYQGVVITDALRMGAVSDEYSVSEATLLAIEAGADIVLVPGDGRKAYQALLNAYRNGALSMERIEQSVARILILKIKSGLIQ